MGRGWILWETLSKVQSMEKIQRQERESRVGRSEPHFPAWIANSSIPQRDRNRERGQPGVGREGGGSCSSVLAPAVAVPGKGSVGIPLMVAPGLGTFLGVQGLKSRGHSVFTYYCWSGVFWGSSKITKSKMFFISFDTGMCQVCTDNFTWFSSFLSGVWCGVNN